MYQGKEKALPGGGCPSICTATAEAFEDPEIRTDLNKTLGRLDPIFRRRFVQASKAGESLTADPSQLGILAAAAMHSLSIRIRSGQPLGKVESLIESTVALLAPA